MLRTALIFFTLAGASLAVSAKDTYVSPHVTRDGRLVEGHFKSAPNNTKLDNYSTKGNVNPYTGQAGTKDPWAAPAPRYESPSIYTPQPRKTQKF
ncbi:hypothetical protein [Methylibium petroleiphilum]